MMQRHQADHALVGMGSPRLLCTLSVHGNLFISSSIFLHSVTYLGRVTTPDRHAGWRAQAGLRSGLTVR